VRMGHAVTDKTAKLRLSLILVKRVGLLDGAVEYSLLQGLSLLKGL